MTPANAIAGFKKAGVCPFNRSAIHVPSVDTSSNASINHAEAASVMSPSVSSPSVSKDDGFTEDQISVRTAV